MTTYLGKMRMSGPILLVVGLCLLFIAAGSLFIPRLGIQNDEVLFASGLYEPFEYRFGIRLFDHRVPLMLLSYLGATKTWFYAAWFKVWPPGPASLRVPMLLGGALAVWLFYLLLRRLAGLRAALAGAALLATDPVYLLVTMWGPILNHHLLLLGVLLCLLRFHDSGSRRWLAAGWFCAGLGVWDKALFAWLLVALAAGTLAAAPWALWRAMNWRNLRVAALWFLLGAAPLLLFNFKSRGETIRGNAALSVADVHSKAGILRYSLDGSLLFGWIAASEAPPVPREATGIAERAAIWLGGKVGRREQDYLPWAGGLAVLLLPLLWRRKARALLLFGLVSFAVGWLQMAVTSGAGSAAHHTLLLWPLPQFVVAVALTEVLRRWRAMAATGIALLVGANLLVLNQYFLDASRNGPSLAFTDASTPLSRLLLEKSNGQVFVADWGLMDTLRFLTQGKLKLRLATDLTAMTSLTEQERASLREWIGSEENLFVGHTEGREYYQGSTQRLKQFATEEGFAVESLAVVPDSFGRPTCELFRFRPAG
jgi:hypothetical protein